jgi:hypothetical protein
MTLTQATLESLRVTLQKLEETAHVTPADIVELKRILLHRIAELELLFELTQDSIAQLPVEAGRSADLSVMSLTR